MWINRVWPKTDQGAVGDSRRFVALLAACCSRGEGQLVVIRQLSSLHQQKPKHHHDDRDDEQCQDRIERWIGIIVPATPPGSAFAADRDLDLVIGYGR